MLLQVHMVNLHIDGEIGLSTGDTYDSSIFADFGTNMLVQRSRFENSGGINPGCSGIGGWAIYRGDSSLPSNRATVRFVDTEWSGIMGGSGGAIGVLTGLVDVIIENCVMRGNIAYAGGGAISFDASPNSRLLIQGSILEANSVRIPQSGEKDTAATVVVFTGGLGAGSEDAYGTYHTPIWRIDDGPVYGVPWELCEAARQYSLEIVESNFPPSWPSGQSNARPAGHWWPVVVLPPFLDGGFVLAEGQASQK